MLSSLATLNLDHSRAQSVEGVNTIKYLVTCLMAGKLCESQPQVSINDYDG